jgi:hypothetical protein
MNRREALKQLAFLTGGALSFSTVAGFMAGCTAEAGSDFSPQILSSAQNDLVIELSERIIPATDTPGAKAAGVNRYVDHMLQSWNTKEEKKHFLEGLDYVDELSNKRHNQNFVDLDKESQVDVMELLEQEALDIANSESNTGLKPFFSLMKEFTIVGYYTSEIGFTQELNATVMPGYYKACISYPESGHVVSR